MVWKPIFQTTQFAVILDSGVIRLGWHYTATCIKFQRQNFQFGLWCLWKNRSASTSNSNHHRRLAGDEIDVLNDSWLFLIWSSDHSPYLKNSVCFRWPIAVIPKSLYLIDNSEVNLTVRAATAEIVTALNRLSTGGIKIKDLLPSMGPSPVTWPSIFIMQNWTVFVGVSGTPMGRSLNLKLGLQP